MKDFRGMKRQRSRNRKPSGNQNNPNRAYESNGPEGTKARGNAQTIYEKYQQLARDANSSGDRVLAENHLQHAEHYFRMIRQMQPQRPVSEFVQRDPFASGFDLDFDDENENEGGEGEGEAMMNGDETQPVFDDQQRYDNRPNGNRPNGERNYNGNNGNRDNRDNRNGERNGRDNNRPNGERNFNGNGNGQPRSFEPRDNRPNGERPNGDRPNNNGERPNNGSVESEFDADGNRRETRRERYERRRQQRLGEQEATGGLPVAPSYIASTEPVAPRPLVAESSEPAARERPAREPREPRPPRDADHLPAFLRAPTPVAAEAPAEAASEDAKPKRGRKRKSEDVGAAEEA